MSQKNHCVRAQNSESTAKSSKLSEQFFPLLEESIFLLWIVNIAIIMMHLKCMHLQYTRQKVFFSLLTAYLKLSLSLWNSLLSLLYHFTCICWRKIQYDILWWDSCFSLSTVSMTWVFCQHSLSIWVFQALFSEVFQSICVSNMRGRNQEGVLSWCQNLFAFAYSQRIVALYKTHLK